MPRHLHPISPGSHLGPLAQCTISCLWSCQELVLSGNRQLSHLPRSPKPCHPSLQALCKHVSQEEKQTFWEGAHVTFMWPLAQDRHEAPPGRPQGRWKVKRAEAPANCPGSAALPCSELLQPHRPIAECLLHTQPLPMALLSQAPGLAPAENGHRAPDHTPAIRPRGPIPALLVVPAKQSICSHPQTPLTSPHPA